MHTIVVLSDRLTHDNQAVQKLKELFPECNIQIIRRTAKESGCGKTQPGKEKVFPRLQFQQSGN